MLKLERVEPFGVLEDWERIYEEVKPGTIFMHPRWSVLSAEYSGGEPIFWAIIHEKPVGYISASYYPVRETLVVPVFDPIFAPYSDFVILPKYRTQGIRFFLESIRGSYKKILVGPIREDSPTVSAISGMGKIISSVSIKYAKLKGDPMEHLYRLKSYEFIKMFDSLERKLNVRVEINGFENLDNVINGSYKLSPHRELALKSILSGYREKVKIIGIWEGNKSLGYTVLVEGDGKLFALLNTVPEEKILLGIWKYIYDRGLRDITLEVPIPTFTYDKELGFKVLKANVYEIT
jgi:hypothetical protein